MGDGDRRWLDRRERSGRFASRQDVGNLARHALRSTCSRFRAIVARRRERERERERRRKKIRGKRVDERRKEDENDPRPSRENASHRDELGA